jgi:erythromycin esterase-like protein
VTDRLPVAELRALLDSLPARPRLLGFGEPTHLLEEFPRLRNQAFEYLVEHEGYRSIAIESDCLAARAVDAYVTGGGGSLDEVLAGGFSHGFAALAANRELVAWMRRYNGDRDHADRLRFHGFDAPLEMMSAASPRAALAPLHDYLSAQLGGTAPGIVAWAGIDALIGGDERWTEPAAAMDPTRSVGGSIDVAQLRLITDDLAALLAAESPRLIAATSLDEWRSARLSARTAAGLLRYHTMMAWPSAARVARLLGERDAMMAANLRAILDAEEHRGPTLVFAHNQHLRRGESTWELAGLSLRWWSAGAITAAQLGDRYAFLASALGSAPERGLGAPAPGTFEGVLSTYPGGQRVFGSRSLAAELRAAGRTPVPRTDMTPEQGYFPLENLDESDGVLFVRDAAPLPDGPGAARER